MKDKKFVAKNLALGLVALFLMVMPLFFVRNADFEGTDDKVTKAIAQDRHYKPWFDPIWEPPSDEIESLLFASQAALGAGFLGYYIGFAKGKKSAGR